MPLAALVASSPLGSHAWRYVQRDRSHEVFALWSAGGRSMRVVERAPGSSASIEQTLVVAQPWEARVALWLLECRLAELGEYWRARPGVAGWSRVRRPMGAPSVDTRANGVVDAAVAPHLHHFHAADVDEVLAALHAPQPQRYVVVRASLDIGTLEIPRIELLHRELPEPLARSMLMRERLVHSQAGVPQLVTRDHYWQAFGPRGDERAARLVADLIQRVQEADAARAAHPGDQELFAEFLDRLDDPRLVALHRRYLYADEEDELMDAGPVEIRKRVRIKRAQTTHDQQHLLTILEASLLARERMRNGHLTGKDPEVRALTRLAYYL